MHWEEIDGQPRIDYYDIGNTNNFTLIQVSGQLDNSDNDVG